MNAVLFGNGKIKNYDFVRQFISPEDMIICCDGGIVHCENMSLKPHVMLGDFDSAPKDLLRYYQSLQIEIIVYEAEKDNTDMEIGLQFAFDKEPSEILIFGGTGSRLDHTLANVSLLRQALGKGFIAKLIDEHNIVQLIDHKIVLKGTLGGLVSLLPYSDAVTGVTTKNLYYPLVDATLQNGYPLGISNVMTEPVAEVSIKGGLLLVIQANDDAP